MPKPSLALARLPQTTVAALQVLGADLAVARIRRKESLENWAQRMGITVPTLLKLESGDPGVAIGLYATALWLMGRDGALADLASPQLDISALELNVQEAKQLGRKRAQASALARINQLKNLNQV